MPRKRKDSKDETKNKNKERMRSLRSNPDYRSEEQERDKEYHRVARSNDLLRTPERIRDASAHRTARNHPQFGTLDRERDAARKREARADPAIRNMERERDASAHQKARQDPIKRKLEFGNIAEQRRKRQKLQSLEELSTQFYNQIREYPTHVCPCCGRLLYKSQTVVINLHEYGFDGRFISSVISTPFPVIHTEVRFCKTCKKYICDGKVPRLALSNGLDFPTIPPELQDLSPLEERLVALRIPFMQIRPLGFQQQSQLKGNVVNVENDLSISTKVIPRRFDETSVVQVQLMRRMCYRRPYMFETIRPHKVHEAAMYLVTTELYTEENIQLSSCFMNSATDSLVDFVCSDEQVGESFFGVEGPSQELEDVVGADETLVHNQSDYRVLNCVRIAPGEGKVPLSQFADSHAEEKSYPTVHCGKKRVLKMQGGNKQRQLSYTEIAKSEIMRYDRRACKPTKVLYAFKKSYNEKVSQCMQTFLRKKRGTGGNYNAAQVTNPVFLKSLVEHDEGYTVFKNLRSSPSYWAAKCKKVIAMVRQLGKCSFFITLSAAETKWNELIVLLMKLVKNRDITEQEAYELTEEEKNELVRSDPVTCMRHFDMRYRALHRNLFNHSNGLFSPHQLCDFFHRLEFQMRGSPHSHGLYWLENTPEYIEGNKQSEKNCIQFIDRYITCSRTCDEETDKYIKYQIHKHSHSCRKGMTGGQNCRFNFPKPPLPRTMILTQLSSHTSVDNKKKLSAMFSKIKEDLNQRGRNPTENPSFSEYLSHLKMTETEYILAIRSSIKRATVFNKREVNEAFINPYNVSLLRTWKANIDIQFVLDTYACAKYCVGYILKSDGGMSKLLKQVNRVAAGGNKEICSKLENYAKVLWNGTEISAQEAAGFLLGIPNVMSSRADIYIDTSPPEERTHILKSKVELEKLDDDDEDIYQTGLLDHYINRPLEFGRMCLAEFSANFEFSKNKLIRHSKEWDPKCIESIDNGLDETADETSVIYYELIDGSGYIRRRAKHCKVIRFRHYSCKQDPQNYWRSQLMLYIPWRDEENDLVTIDAIQKGESLKKSILEKQALFHHDLDMSEEKLKSLVNQVTVGNAEESDDDNDDALAHEMEQDQLANVMLHPSHSKGSSSKCVKFLPPRLIEHAEYNVLMRSLNAKQRKFVLNALFHVKAKRDPFHMFLSGGAGVGKSHVITAIVQSVLRYFGAEPGRNQANMPVIVTAFTGKAAFNVFGMTLHSAFHLPPVQSSTITDLRDDVRTSLQSKFNQLKLIIIDEISMCSLKLLQFIDKRMCQIKGNNEDFGGCSVLVVGHLRQLPPICGQFPFESEKGKEAVVNYLWQKFKVFELDEIMRQQGDMQMCKALNNMSEGAMDNDDIALMKGRQITKDNQPPFSAIWLFRTNNECARHNKIVHGTLTTEGFLSVASDFVEGKANRQKKDKLLKEARTLSQQDCDGLRYETFLKEQANYFVSTNIDVQDGLFNGATGRLMHIEKRNPEQAHSSNASSVLRVWMLFENPLIGAEKRSSYLRVTHGQLPTIVETTWTPIEKIRKNLSKLYRENLKVVRTQFPLVACDGTTVAKSQGSSLNTVVVSTREGKLTRAALYVACSRATSLTGLYIDGDFTPPEPPKVPDIVGEEMDRLRQNPLQLSLRFLQDCNEVDEKIYFHNIQSLNEHYPDITSDHCAMAANFILLVEPHLLSQDVYNFPHFSELHRINCSSSRNSEGVLLLARDLGQAQVLDGFTDFNDATHCMFVKFATGRVTVVTMYKHPRYSKADFLILLEETLTEVTGDAMFIGDINIDLLNRQNLPIHTCFSKFGFSSKLSLGLPSTNGGTQIDCCFANFNVRASLYESYYSYHKPICVTFKK